MNETGIEINGYCGKWDADLSYAMGARFATIRMSTGLDKDINGVVNYDKAVAAGIAPICYHWLDPRKPIKAQIAFFLAAVGARYSYQGVMIDLEDTKSIKARKGIFAELELYWFPPIRLEGRDDIVYTNADYSQRYIRKPTATTNGDISAFRHKLIVASWGGAALTMPWPWQPTRQMAWQFVNDIYSGNQWGIAGREVALYVWNGEMPSV
jgi:hypothetical protein